MKHLKIILLPFLFLLLFVSCSKEQAPQFARINGKEYSMKEFHSFAAMIYNHPVIDRSLEFPGKRKVVTLFIETKIFAKDASSYKKQVLNSPDAQWKNYYIPGQMFMKNYIQKNMGFSDEEIQKFYDTRINEIIAEYNLSPDVALGIARVFIIEKMFIEKFPPTEEFLGMYSGLDPKIAEKAWIEEKKKKIVEFFRDYYFEKEYGTSYPKDASELIGTYISESDLEIVTSWMGAEQRESINNNPSAKNGVVGYMMTWKLFAQAAKDRGYTKTKSYKLFKKNFDEYEVVRYYMNTIYPTQFASSVSINEENLAYSIWDQSGRPFADLDEKLLAKKRNDLVASMKKISLDSVTYSKRQKAEVKFLQPDYIDHRGDDPVKLLEQADSLIGMLRTDKAKLIYENLSNNYSFTPEGREANNLLAQIYTDSKEYRKAITSYRNYILHSTDTKSWCKNYFMIAYIYGEELNNQDLAGVNYRWILKNTPSCDFAKDAEFMTLHLGEPILDVNELQEQAKRQGVSEL